MQKFVRLLSYINPFILYIPILYGIIQVFEVWFGIDSILQICWNKIRELLGDNKAYYVIGLLNVYSIIFFWLALLFFLALDKYKIPKNISDYKIQQKISEIEKPENTRKV